MEKEFTVTAFSENNVGLLNRISIIFTRRRVNIESLTVSASSIQGIHKFTIVCIARQEQIEKLVRQIEKLVEVLRAFYHTSEEIIHQEVALYKVTTEMLIKSNAVESIVLKHGARILDITPDYVVIEKTGNREETQALFELLYPFKVTQFTRSGRVAVTKDPRERLTDYLKEMDSLERNESARNLS